VKPSQPSWEVGFVADAEPPASRFVRVEVTLRLEVVDEGAVRAAARAALEQDLGGSPEAFFFQDLASCVGHLVRPGKLFEGIPGVQPAGSGTSAGYYLPDAE